MPSNSMSRLKPERLFAFEFRPSILLNFYHGASPFASQRGMAKTATGRSGNVYASMKSLIKDSASPASRKDTTDRKRRRDATTEQIHPGDLKLNETTKSVKRLKKSRRGKQLADVIDPESKDPLVSRDLETKPSNSHIKEAISHDHCYKYILAPMVGASELAFRLLCRNYGATLAYTPMMSALEFAEYEESKGNDNSVTRNSHPCGFQTCPEDRPLVCHFGASTPDEFAGAVTAAAPYCDAVDLNLGCPQRTAFLGHFGSYLLDPKDRDLLCRIVRAGAEAGRLATPKPVPVYVKIRLLDTLDETIQLCRQLIDAGAALIAIHARYRATWDRKGPGARDGAALLDQVQAIRQALPQRVPVIANGNVCSYQDVVDNFESTRADGIMSAEGLLDDPTMFLPRLGSLEANGDDEVTINTVDNAIAVPDYIEKPCERELKLWKRLTSIEKTERKLRDGKAVSGKKMKKVTAKTKYLAELERIRAKLAASNLPAATLTKAVSLRELYKRAADKLLIAREYLRFVRVFPASMRTVIFHIRRMLKSYLARYQLLEECLVCGSIEQVEALLKRMEGYELNPDSFVYDRLKAQQDKESLERKKREEGKRKAYEERMIRKAKREGKADLHFYLYIGAAVPTVEEVERLKRLDKESQLLAWKKKHSQHCMTYHLDPLGCQRSRSCCFLHAPARGANAFDETDELAG